MSLSHRSVPLRLYFRQLLIQEYLKQNQEQQAQQHQQMQRNQQQSGYYLQA